MKCFHKLEIITLNPKNDIVVWCIKCGHAIEGRLEEEE